MSSSNFILRQEKKPYRKLQSFAPKFYEMGLASECSEGTFQAVTLPDGLLIYAFFLSLE